MATTIYIAPQAYIIVVLTIGFNVAIAKIAHKQARQIAAEQQPYNTLNVAISHSTRKISRTLGLVLGTYLFCTIMPQTIMAAIEANILHLETYERYMVALRWSDAWVNPLIYAWRFKDFRIAFQKIFTGAGSFNEVF